MFIIFCNDKTRGKVLPYGFYKYFLGIINFLSLFCLCAHWWGVTGDLLFIKSGKLKFLKYVYDMV